MSASSSFFQRVASSLIIPITILPLAAVLLALGSQLGIGPLEAAGFAMIRHWLPLFYGIGIAIGFTDGDGMGALSVAAGFLVMISTAEAVSGDPTLNLGVLGGIVAGVICTWIFNRTKETRLPEFLALFSGKRLGPILSAVAGLFLGYFFGLLWPPIHDGIIRLGEWMYGAGGLGVFAYGASLRLLIPTGLHHILMQLVDTQLGGWVDPVSGRLFAGEYIRFLAGDPQAGRILSGFFLTLGFGPLGAGLAIAHEARPELRRKVLGLMTTGILTAMILGITEPVEFAFIFASPVLFGLHVLYSGLASFAGWAFEIHLGGYALPMGLINSALPNARGGLLLIPLGIAYSALYYYSFRAVIRWLRPPILGQVAEGGSSEADQPAAVPAGEAAALLQALGGAANLAHLTVCMTRLRVTAADPVRVDEGALRRLGASAVIRSGAGVQVVLGARAYDVFNQVQSLLGTPGAAPGAGVLLVLSPVSGRVVPLAAVEDPVFAGGSVGEGAAVMPSDGRLVAPVTGEIAVIFPGGHAIGLRTPQGVELLIHVGLETAELQGEGFDLQVTTGQQVQAGQALGRVDLARLGARGKSLVTPVLVTNPASVAGVELIATGQVEAGQPLLRVQARLPAG